MSIKSPNIKWLAAGLSWIALGAAPALADGSSPGYQVEALAQAQSTAPGSEIERQTQADVAEGASQDSVDALRREVAALRTDLQRVLPTATAIPTYHAYGIDGMEAVETELNRVAAQIAALDDAVASGLDPAFAAPAYAILEQQRRSLQLELVGLDVGDGRVDAQDDDQDSQSTQKQRQGFVERWLR